MGRFDVTLRVLACPRCGGPVHVPVEGGSVPCAYCGDDLAIERRPHTGVHVESASPTPGESPYGLGKTPPGPIASELQNLLSIGPEAGVPKLRALFADTRRRLETARTRAPAEVHALELSLYFLAHTTANLAIVAREIDTARAVVETAMESVTDPGLVHSLTCRMAMLAVREGELEAAEAWLARADPSPVDPVLSSDLRVATATVHIARSRYDLVPPLLGRTHEHVRLDDSNLVLGTVLRADALEALGEPEAAWAELAWLMKQNPGGQPGALLTKAVLDSLRTFRDPCPITAARVDGYVRRLRVTGLGCWLVVVVFASGIVNALAGLRIAAAVGVLLLLAYLVPFVRNLRR